MPEDSSYQYESEEYDSDNQDEDVINRSISRGQISEDNKDSLVICNQEKVPCFKSVSVVNSNDVHFGNKTVYKGPVTIKQIVYPSGEVVNSECINDLEETVGNGRIKNQINGIYNPSFVKNDRELPKPATSNGEIPNHDEPLLVERLHKGTFYFSTFNPFMKNCRKVDIFYLLFKYHCEVKL